MAVYAKKLTKAWRSCFKQYENLCGFEPMHQDEIDSGKMTSREVWDINVDWIRDIANDVERINTPLESD